jgi:NodT family efflux transporter outer membrane factor (OMF) lipoprotein
MCPEKTGYSYAGVLLAALLAGCGVGPDYKRPALDVPAAFNQPQPMDAAAIHVDSAWWRHFGDPVLNGLIEGARARSPDVQAAEARIIQADQAARVTGSPLLPAVTGTGSQNWTREGIGAASGATGAVSVLPGGSRYIEQRTYSAELSASYEIDFWGKNRDALKAAQATATADRFDAETVWLTTASSIATTYFQALGYRDRLEIAKNNLGSAEDLLKAYQARLEYGTATALDVSQQQALVAGYRAQIPSFESQYRQQVIALSILVGVPPERISFQPVRLITLALPEVTPGLPADILRRRPDVAYAEWNLISQNQTVRQDVANFFPSLQLTASGGLSSLALSALTGPGTLIASLGSSLTQTIFDNGLKGGTLGEAKGRYRELVSDYVKAVLQAFSDVETALAQTSFDATQESLETEAVRTAQHSLDIARAQLAAGTVDQTTVLNTETTLFNDQDTLAQVRISRFLALVSLYKALGGGWIVPEHAA